MFKTNDQQLYSVLDESTQIKGTIRGHENLMVCGRFEGSIDIEAQLWIKQGALVKAQLNGRRILIGGIVAGDVSASEYLELLPEAQVLGNISAPQVKIHQGARLSGQLDIGQGQTVLKPVQPLKTEAPARPTLLPTRPSSAIPKLSPLRKESERRRRRIVVKKRG